MTEKQGKMPDKITIGDKYGLAMKMTDQAVADAYFKRCVEHTIRVNQKNGKPITRAQAERIEKMNLGYYAGYYDSETRERVERLFKCKHPFFGSIAKNGTPDAETAFNIGVAIGGAAKGVSR